MGSIASVRLEVRTDGRATPGIASPQVIHGAAHLYLAVIRLSWADEITTVLPVRSSADEDAERNGFWTAAMRRRGGSLSPDPPRQLRPSCRRGAVGRGLVG